MVSPKICREILKFNVKVVEREFDDNDLNGAFCVISATDNEQVNSHIFELCKEKNILVNTVDDKEKCGFIFPALVQKNSVTVGITTSGKSPIYAKYLKEQFLNIFIFFEKNRDKSGFLVYNEFIMLYKERIQLCVALRALQII